MIRFGLLVALMGFALNSCGTPSGPAFAVGTTALDESGRLKPEYGAALGGSASLRSFPFTWTNVPAGTKAVALILLDKSYSDYVHWLAADMDPALGGLADQGSKGAPFPQGANDTGGYGYFGPMPPDRHLYQLTVYALSAPTGLEPRFLVGDLQEAMKGKILASATLDLPYDPLKK